MAAAERAREDQMPHILGIDAGGTHTRCCIADERGKILSLAVGGPANTNFVAPEEALAAVEGPLAQALESSPAGTIETAVIAGPHLHPNTERMISKLARPQRAIMTDEFEAALAAALGAEGRWEPEACGVVIMAGTGSFCKGRDPEGKLRYSGGWGPMIGDEGSGYDIAREALTAVAAASDGRAPETALTELILSHLEIDGLSGLRKKLYNPPLARHKFAELARCVFEAADSGDAVAAETVAAETVAAETLAEAGRRLARLAAPVLEELFGAQESFPIALCGGVLQRESVVTRALVTQIRDLRPNADVLISKLQPMIGTIIIGLETLGVRVDSAIAENLIDGDSKMRALVYKGREK